MAAHRKPTAQKKLEGTHRPDRANPKEPKFSAAAPPKPIGLRKVAASVWDLVVADCMEQRTLARVDFGIVEAFCLAVEQMRAANDHLATHPQFYQMKKGGLWKESPAAKRLSESLIRVATLAAQLGLSPASRSKVSSIANDEEEDPLAALMREAAEQATTH